MNADAAPQLAGWCYLPEGAATGAIAQSSYNILAQHTANAGEWLVSYTGPNPMVAGEYIWSWSVGVPSDNHDAVNIRFSDVAAGPSVQANIVGYDSNVGFGNPGWVTTNDTPFHFMLWRLPRLR